MARRATLTSVCLATTILAHGPAHAATRPDLLQTVALSDLSRLSIDELADIEITSVSKQPQPLSNAPAAIYVITHDDIVRSGARSVPEILRLAPNLEVMQTSPSDYVIAARGLNGNAADQNFSNKLLVLIDGRSVYTPLYSGVYWDMQDLLAENIDRIEVISGPGATLWGANAVNGVINIVTKSAADTQGGQIAVGIGTEHNGVSVQYGGKAGQEVAYRIYAKGFRENAFDTTAGTDADDGWSRLQGGFRMDWTPGSGDLVTFQGDIYNGDEDQAGAPDELIAGGNLMARWQHPLDDGAMVQVLAYYDETRRSINNGGGAFVLRTYDLEAQHSFALDWNTIVWGVGGRLSRYDIQNRVGPADSLLFVPNARSLGLFDAFIEDHVKFAEILELTLGLKLENDPYSAWSAMPSARLSWKPSENTMLWTAVSRAIRSPTPFDRDVLEYLGTTAFLSGNPDFRPEELTAYEVGYRGQVSSRMSLSLSLYDNVYRGLKSIELGPPGGAILQWGNGLRGEIYGAEAWGNYQALDWWRLSAGLSLQHQDLSFEASSSGLVGTVQAANDPHHWASLRSSMDLGSAVSLEADLRYVGELRDPALPEYAELNARLAWKATERLEIALSGFNLLHARHQEFAPGDAIPRSFLLQTHLTF